MADLAVKALGKYHLILQLYHDDLHLRTIAKKRERFFRYSFSLVFDTISAKQ